MFPWQNPKPLPTCKHQESHLDSLHHPLHVHEEHGTVGQVYDDDVQKPKGPGHLPSPVPKHGDGLLILPGVSLGPVRLQRPGSTKVPSKLNTFPSPFSENRPNLLQKGGVNN